MKYLRLVKQQLLNSTFQTPQDLVSYMGVMQAQNYAMVKWAVGTRIPNITEHSIAEAINQGTILRTHILRPTWHLIASQDIYDFLQLTAPRLTNVMHSYGSRLGMRSDTYSQTNSLIRACLENSSTHLTRPELGQYLEKKGFRLSGHQLTQVMFSAELAGIACSGIMKGRQQTYALLEQRVPNRPVYHKADALEKLARKYFTSHGPATLADFSWWSGLIMKEARQAMDYIKKDAIIEVHGTQEFWMIDTPQLMLPNKPQVHLLPAFDEYLVSYKNRDLVIPKLNYDQVITSNGIFKPTILYDGEVIGTWFTLVKKGKHEINPLFFNSNRSSELLIELQKTIEQFSAYIN